MKNLFIVVATFGVLTLLIPAFLALVENDLKKIIAYSTISQMGYIILALGFGTALGLTAALFHLINHALLKSMLFLAAGAVIYSVRVRDISRLGGLVHKMPITACIVLIGGLAVAGLPPLNGFASKLLIYEAGLEVAFEKGGVLGRLYLFYTLLAIFVSAVTLLYFMRLFYSVFLGMPSKEVENAKEAPIIMRIPLIILAILSVIFGIVPQLPLKYLINPVIMGTLDLSIPPIEITYLGYNTGIGFYSATVLTIVMLVSALVIYALYRSSLTLYTKTTLPPPTTTAEQKEFKFEVFTGGEATPPLLNLEEVKITPEEFSYALKTSFKGLYDFGSKGGFEGIIIRAFRSIIGSSTSLDIIRYENVRGYVTIYLLVFVLILTYVLLR